MTSFLEDALTLLEDEAPGALAGKPAGRAYELLLDLLRGKDCFVITTNVDHRHQVAGFNKRRLFYTQGDYGLFQCSKPCQQETFDNKMPCARCSSSNTTCAFPASSCRAARAAASP